jgi:hypothetical protein
LWFHIGVGIGIAIGIEVLCFLMPAAGFLSICFYATFLVRTRKDKTVKSLVEFG